MIFRYLLLLLVPFQLSWASEDPIELTTHVHIGSLTITDSIYPLELDPIEISIRPVEPEEFQSIPAVDAVFSPSVYSAPLQGSLEDDEEASKKIRNTYFNIDSGSRPQIVSTGEDDFQVFALRNGLIKRYFVNVGETQTQYTYPETSSLIEGFNLRYEYRDYDSDEEPEHHWMPMALEQNDNGAWFWQDEYHSANDGLLGNNWVHSSELGIDKLVSGKIELILNGIVEPGIGVIKESRQDGFYYFDANGGRAVLSEKHGEYGLHNGWNLFEFFENSIVVTNLEDADEPQFKIVTGDQSVVVKTSLTPAGSLIHLIGSDGVSFLWFARDAELPVALDFDSDLGQLKSCETYESELVCLVESVTVAESEEEEDQLNIALYKWDGSSWESIVEVSQATDLLFNQIHFINGYYLYEGNWYMSTLNKDNFSHLYVITSRDVRHVRKFGAENELMRIIPAKTDGQFMWVGYWFGRVQYSEVTALDEVPLVEEEELKGDAVFWLPTEDIPEDRNLEDNEEREIPRAELSGTFSLFMLMNILLLVSIRRKK